MKPKFTLNRLLHNDKLMMIVSLVLAVIIWALVVYGPGNAQDQVITGVPVSITLNDYASQTLNLRITEGANATATVTVHGQRAVVSRLSSADIQVTADTGNVIKEGTYPLRLRATGNGDYTITRVVGDNGINDTVTITCDVWKETAFPMTVEMPAVSVPDVKAYQFGTPVISGDGVQDGSVVLAGPKTEIGKIDQIVAVIDDDAEIEEATVFTARLEARDQKGTVLTTVSFPEVADGKVSVTVPVMIYRKVTLTPTVKHLPAGYAKTEKLVTVTPASVELWGVPAALDDYEESLHSQMEVDFDRLDGTALSREIQVSAAEGIRPVNGNETLTVKIALSGITRRTYEVPLNLRNVTVSGSSDGYAVSLIQQKLSVTLCGTAKALGKIRAEDIHVTADVSGLTAGQQTVQARVEVPSQDTVWAYYGETASGVEMLLSVEERAAVGG